MTVFENDRILTGPKISHFRGFTVLTKWFLSKLQIPNMGLLEAYEMLARPQNMSRHTRYM